HCGSLPATAAKESVIWWYGYSSIGRSIGLPLLGGRYLMTVQAVLGAMDPNRSSMVRRAPLSLLDDPQRVSIGRWACRVGTSRVTSYRISWILTCSTTRS